MNIIGNGNSKIRKQYEINGYRKRSLKQEIINRDGKKCFYCSFDKKLELDHIVPLFVGGGWELENLQLLCRECHIKKTKRIDRAFVQLVQKIIERTLHNLDKLLIDSVEIETSYLDTV